MIMFPFSLYPDKFKDKKMKRIGFKENWYMLGRSEPLAENTLARVKDRATKEAGVKRIIIHEFRHSRASGSLDLFITVYVRLLALTL